VCRSTGGERPASPALRRPAYSPAMSISDDEINEEPNDGRPTGAAAGDADGVDTTDADGTDGDSDSTDGGDSDGTDAGDSDGTDGGDSDGADA